MSSPPQVFPLPLSRLRVLVTRPTEQAASLLEALEAAGATAIPYPTIVLEPPPSWDPFDAAVGALATYSWMVFTSPSAVRFAVARTALLADGLRAAGAPLVAAVGSETAHALTTRRIPVAVVPEDQRQEGLIQALGPMPPGTRVLFPQALGGRELLREELVKAGASVHVVPVSQTVPLALDTAPPPFDAAIFASPSALRSFLKKFPASSLRDKVVAVMGPTTRDSATAAGLVVQVMPSAPSVPALVAALIAFHRPSPKLR